MDGQVYLEKLKRHYDIILSVGIILDQGMEEENKNRGKKDDIRQNLKKNIEKANEIQRGTDSRKGNDILKSTDRNAEKEKDFEKNTNKNIEKEIRKDTGSKIKNEKHKEKNGQKEKDANRSASKTGHIKYKAERWD